MPLRPEELVGGRQLAIMPVSEEGGRSPVATAGLPLRLQRRRSNTWGGEDDGARDDCRDARRADARREARRRRPSSAPRSPGSMAFEVPPLQLPPPAERSGRACATPGKDKPSRCAVISPRLEYGSAGRGPAAGPAAGPGAGPDAGPVALPAAGLGAEPADKELAFVAKALDAASPLWDAPKEK
mmetsp:Transcript_46178/g.144436  ORF Transcript_46178/g.144436 Transcript_46178/m.144436 type:complete len:184 (-) Transcript_46178:55-606(-)